MNHPDDLLVDADQAAQVARAAAEKVRSRAAQRHGAVPLLPPAPEGAKTGPVGAPAPPATPAPEPEPVPGPKEFDARWREPFTGLLYLGQLTEEFEVWGHRFQIQTPSHLEKINIGLVHKPYAETMSSELVFATAMVAAYLRQVDGQLLPQPVVNDPKETALAERFRWVSENLRQPVITKIYNRCLALEDQVEQVLDAMGEARG